MRMWIYLFLKFLIWSPHCNFPRVQWTTMDNNWQQWTTMDNNGQWWTTMDNNWQQWTTMDNNGQRWTTMHYRLRVSIGFLNVQKSPKVNGCFSLKELPNLTILHFLWRLWPKFCAKKISQLFQKANMAKIMVNVQKRLKGASVQADFLHGENIDHAEKKSSK